MINTTAAIISECVCNHLGLRLKYIKIQRVSTDGTQRANPQSRSDIKGTGASSRPAPSGLESVRPPWQELISDLCTRAPDAARRAGGPRGLLWVQFHLVSPLQRREEQQPLSIREPEGKMSPSLRPGSANLQLSAGLHPSHPPLFPLTSSTLLCLPYNLNLLLIFFPHGRKYSSVQRGSEAEATVARNWKRNSRRRREQKSRREGGKREREREKLPDAVRQPREEASNRLATTTVQQTHVRECPTADSIVTLMLNNRS